MIAYRSTRCEALSHFLLGLRPDDVPTYSAMAEKFGLTRSAVAGLVYRLRRDGCLAPAGTGKKIKQAKRCDATTYAVAVLPPVEPVAEMDVVEDEQPIQESLLMPPHVASLAEVTGCRWCDGDPRAGMGTWCNRPRLAYHLPYCADHHARAHA